MQTIPSVGSTRTTIVVKTTKEGIHVPLEELAVV